MSIQDKLRQSTKVKETVRLAGAKSIQLIAKVAHVDMQTLAYQQIGILKWQNDEASGERFALAYVTDRLKDVKEPVIFDVGANLGEFSLAAKAACPRAKVVAFEPNPKLADGLNQKFAGQVSVVSAAAGSEPGTLTLHNYHDSGSSGATAHGTLYADVHRVVHGSTTTETIEVPVVTLDAYTAEHGIKGIDFLKVDVEGHELEVFRGCRRLLSENGIRHIQFEFNEMNVFSRTFLRDFFDLLVDFDFYRLDTNRLIPLGEYSTQYEIFRFQNILAVKRS